MCPGFLVSEGNQLPGMGEASHTAKARGWGNVWGPWNTHGVGIVGR